MIILSSPTFDSLFHATLFSNLKGYPVCIKAGESLVRNSEECIDVDTLNWESIYDDHSARFGSIVWYEATQAVSDPFKQHIELALRNKQSVLTVIEEIKSAIKFGVGHVQPA